MASRTKLLGVQEYDRDGGLDYFIKGTQWGEWFNWRLDILVNRGHSVKESREIIRQDLMNKFEQCVDRAIDACKLDDYVEE